MSEPALELLAYSCCVRIMSIQSEMSERALELLALPDDQPSYLLDLGCGSGYYQNCLML